MNGRESHGGRPVWGKTCGVWGRGKELWLPSVADPAAAFMLCMKLWLEHVLWRWGRWGGEQCLCSKGCDSNSVLCPSAVGDHGYDNALPSMHPFLAARGPAFRRGFRLGTMANVDIYPMMCHILGLAPRPHNGTFANTKCLLADQWCISVPEAIGIVIGVFMVLSTFTCIIIITKNRVAPSRPFARLQLQSDDDDPLIG